MTRLLIDLTYLRPVTVGGSETYVAGVLGALLQSRDELELEIAVLGTRDALDSVGATSPDECTGLEMPSPVAGMGSLWLLAASTIGISRAWTFDPDVVWSPGNFQAVTSRRRQVITVHDLLHRNRRDLLGRATLVQRDLLFPVSCRRASRIVVLSDQVRTDLVDNYGQQVDDGRKIRLVPPGTDHVSLARRGRVPDILLQRGFDPTNYLIYPAMFEPHKNHALLVEAFCDAVDKGVSSHLVRTGAPGSDAVRARVDAICERRGAKDVVHLVPAMYDHADVLALIGGARALLFPSMHEGYGLTVVEAAALGTPAVVASGVPASAQLGDCVTSLPFDDRRAWADRIVEAAVGSKSLTAKASAAQSVATSMTWDRAAESTAKVFHESDSN